MPSVITIDSKIAVGHNQAGSLALVSAYKDANDVYFIMPRVITSRGIKTDRANGYKRWQGYPYAIWRLPLLVAQYNYLFANLTGPVTIRTTLDGGVTYANYNAWSSLPELSELADQFTDFVGAIGVGMPKGFTGPGWPSVEWSLTKLVAI